MKRPVLPDPAYSKKVRWLIVPMEILERELNGNLLLCMEAIEAGWQCIIGTKRAIYDAARFLPPGIVFLKSITANEIGYMRLLKSAGHKLTSLDVEGLVYVTLEEFVSNRFTNETLDETDMVFFWGEIQRKVMAEAHPAYADKFVTTGSPIADLWKSRKLHALYEERTGELKNRYGRYILIPSVFALPNHHLGREATLDIMLRDRMIRDIPEVHAFWRNYEEYINRIFVRFIDIVPYLSKSFPDHKIIIRPHPSESHKAWIEKAKGMHNVEVIFEGPITPWVLGADAILHWGCTTGIEAHLIGKPVVAYCPIRSEEDNLYDHRLPHSVSVICESPESVVKTLREVIDNPVRTLARYPHVFEGDKALNEWIYNAGDRSAAREIITHLKTIDAGTSPLRSVPPEKFSWKEIVWRIIEIPASIKPFRRLLPKRIQIGLNARSYGRHKTKDIETRTLKKIVTRLVEILDVAPVKTEKLRENLYWIGRGE